MSLSDPPAASDDDNDDSLAIVLESGRSRIDAAPPREVSLSSTIWAQLGADSSKVGHGRGRAIKGVIVPCNDIAELEENLTKFLQHNDAANIEERVVEFAFQDRAPFSVARLELFNESCTQPVMEDGTNSLPDLGAFDDSSALPEVIVTVEQALRQMRDPKDTVRRQRQLAKQCLRTVERVDGFRYAFHGVVKAVAEASYRFFYYCYDSTLNKDCVANGRPKTLNRRKTPRTDRSNGRLKPTYECKGTITVRFDSDRGTMTVVYRHRDLHGPYDSVVSRANGGDAVELNNLPVSGKRKRSSELGGVSAEASLRQQSLTSLLMFMRHDQAITSPSRQEATIDSTVTIPNSDVLPGHVGGQTTVVIDETTPLTNRHGPHIFKGGASINCRARRTKCNGARPTCSTCLSRDQECAYDKPKPPPPPPNVRINAPYPRGVLRAEPEVEKAHGQEMARLNTKLNLQSARNQALAAEIEKRVNDLPMLQADQDALRTDFTVLQGRSEEMLDTLNSLEVTRKLLETRNKTLKEKIDTLEATAQLQAATPSTTSATSTSTNAAAASRRPVQQITASATNTTAHISMQQMFGSPTNPTMVSTPVYANSHNGYNVQPFYTATQPQQQAEQVQTNRASTGSAQHSWPSNYPYAANGLIGSYWSHTR